MATWIAFSAVVTILLIKCESMDLKQKNEVLLAHIGQQVSLECPTSSTATWLINNKKVHENNPVYDILSVKEEDEGEYVCIGWNERHIMVKTSLTLVVAGVMDSSRAVPSVRRVERGDKVQLLCRTDTDPIWFFKKDLGLLATVIHNTEASSHGKAFYKIHSASLDDHGYYYCSGSIKNHTNFLAQFRLIVNYERMIDPSMQVVPENTDAFITCYTGAPAVWTKRDRELPYNVYALNNNTLWIVNATLENRGYYECQGEDGLGQTFSSFSLVKVLIRDNSRVAPQNSSVVLYKAAYFICYSNNDVIWKFKGKSVEDDPVIHLHTQRTWPLWEHRLIIYSADYRHRGTYQCLGEEDDYLLFIAETYLRVKENEAQDDTVEAEYNSKESHMAEAQSNHKVLSNHFADNLFAIVFWFILAY